MEAENIDFENATEEQLAALRGDEVSPTDEQEVQQEADQPAEEEVAEAAEAQAEEETPPEEPVAEAAAEPEPEPEPEPEKPSTIMIPKQRYDAVMARLKDAEARLNDTPEPQQQTAQPEQGADLETQLADLDGQLAEAVKDGDGNKVTELMRQSRQLQSQAMQNQLAQVQMNAQTQSVEQVKYDNLVARVEQLVPESDPESDSYDEGLVLEVSEMAEAFELKGYTATAALSKALDYVKPGWLEPGAEVEAAPEPTPEPEKRATKVSQNVADENSQPPQMEVGENSDSAGMKSKIDVMKISDKDFENLTEQQLAELRGDFA